MSTQDEVISLVEFKSPPPHNVRKAKPRTNRVSSPPAQSVYSHKSHDVVSLFSVKNAAKFKKHSDESTEDSQSLETTEISDDVFAKPGNVRKPSYKEKIRERFNVKHDTEVIDDLEGNSQRKGDGLLTKWFNCEGRLIMQENPVLNRSLREPKPIKDSNITTYSPPTNKIDCSEVVVIRDRILELHLKNLKFVHHPLFSIEHVFERKLTICHEKYKHFLENNNLSRLLKRLDAIRHVKKNLQSLRKGEIGLEVKKYSQEIKELRKLSYEEGKVVRGNTKLILETWKCIKKIREANGYSNTNIKLAIKKEPVDTAEEKINQEQQIKEAIEEILEEHKLLHKEKIRQYKKEIQTWKSLDNIDVDKDEDPPKKPIFNIDEKKIESEVRKQFEESFKPPGEPILTFFLLTDNEVTKEVSNAKENVRRNAVNSTKISLRVVCNKIEVCKTHLTHLNNSFNVQIKEDISIQLTNIPESITIEVIEQPKSLLRRKITEIELTLPGQKSAPRDVEKLFEKDEIVHYKHEGVGSGIRLASILSDYNLTFDEDLNLNTRGILMYNLGWEGSMKEQTLEVEDSIEQLVNDVLDKNGIINVEKLHEWITSFTPDPQDPKNSILYEYISSFDKNLTYEKKSNHFRLNPHLESLQFCDIKEIENNIRLTMLQLRNQNEIEFDGMTIPNRVKEIPLNALADYKKRLAVEDKVFYEDDFDVDFEQHRSNSKKYLRQVHNKIFQKCKNYDNNLLYENVVNEKYLPYLEQLIKVLLSNFLNWFRWRPKISQPLPIVKNDGEDIKEKFGQFSEQVNIIIKINSGINLTSGRKQEPNDNKKNQNEVQRFIEISYNGYRIRSSISFGENPCWNEDLTLPIESQQIDYLNPNALSGIIFVNLFDLKNSKSNIEETDWIGCIDIPLAAVCCNNTLCGNFKVKVPYFLQNLDEELDKNKIKSPRVNSYLNMSVSIEPNIPKLTPSMVNYYYLRFCVIVLLS
ncbi:unnamed protein product [Brassicogethes aeneus]|uniref:CC2D2A N-terminal C2 domain-containing protein n=1 Tax=Brassicogethes aeneus TaxID=1431903 RepID=A0A9P0FA85_BRAAE|nr:unnamed protein product [Brassicogethes aeneus]